MAHHGRRRHVRCLADDVRRGFSGFYWAMLVILAALMFRPLAFDYRSKVAATRWRTTWDWLLFIGSAVPPVICGVAFGNLLQGVPFEIDATMRPIYTGSFFGLLNPFGLLCGVLALLMVVFHGANYLALRTEGDLHDRAVKVSGIAGILTAVLFVLGGIWVYMGIDGYVATAGLDPAGPANPLAKTVEVQAGAWFANYSALPLLWVVPVLGIAGALLGSVLVKKGRIWPAIFCSSAAILGIVLTPLISMFPFVMPSSTMFNAGLTFNSELSPGRGSPGLKPDRSSGAQHHVLFLLDCRSFLRSSPCGNA